MLQQTACLVVSPIMVGSLRVRLVRRETGLSPPVKYFIDNSKTVLILWISFAISVSFCYAFVRVCLLMPFGHLL